MTKPILGIDIGGTGIKGALIDTSTGKMLTERKKLLTPKPSKPDAVLQTVNELIDLFDWRGKDIGFGFPCIIHKEVCHSANNIDKEWLGMNLYEFFRKGTGSKVSLVNDADAAGLAEAQFGAGKDKEGLVILLTLGTGIGSGVIFNGTVIPNVELGSINWKDGMAEDYVSNKARKQEDLSWEVWATELSKYLNHIERIYSPNQIILGGGVSKKFNNYKKYIKLKRKTNITTAHFLNGAGSIGAALYFVSKA